MEIEKKSSKIERILSDLKNIRDVVVEMITASEEEEVYLYSKDDLINGLDTVYLNVMNEMGIFKCRLKFTAKENFIYENSASYSDVESRDKIVHIVNNDNTILGIAKQKYKEVMSKKL
jgi:predicted house-cleaning noncanonical NTP pyrophosphatase (MazG superfamily)